MNTLGFIVRRLARTFGYRNEQERLVTARREGLLLNEAEFLLGQAAWKDAEHIEELADEYWKIMEIDGQIAKLRAEMRELELANQRLADRHAEMDSRIESELAGLTAEKARKTGEAISLMHEAQNFRATVEATRKKFEGLKTKYKVLSDQGGTPADLESITNAMRQLKDVYNTDKRRLAETATRIREAEGAAQATEKQIAEYREAPRQKLAALMSELGKSSNLVAQSSARIGALERTRRELAFAVGSYLSRHSRSKHPAIRQAVRRHRGLIAKISTLHQSITYNRILAGRVD